MSHKDAKPKSSEQLRFEAFYTDALSKNGQSVGFGLDKDSNYFASYLQIAWAAWQAAKLNLCDDEGCDHHGTDHECIEPNYDADNFMSEVRAELTRARTKFPGDRIMTIALAEEFGELCKAVLDEPRANVRKEAVQCAVMCARVVLDGDSSVNDWRAEKGLDQLIPE